MMTMVEIGAQLNSGSFNILANNIARTAASVVRAVSRIAAR
jgi:hypothetical protein